IDNPSAKGEYRHKVELETLPWYGVLTPDQLENQPVSFIVVCDGERGCVAEDIDIANRPLEDAEQVCGRHHRVRDHIEAPLLHNTRIRQPNCRVAGARHGE